MLKTLKWLRLFIVENGFVVGAIAGCLVAICFAPTAERQQWGLGAGFLLVFGTTALGAVIIGGPLRLVRRAYVHFQPGGIFIEVSHDGRVVGSGNPYWGHKGSWPIIVYCPTPPSHSTFKMMLDIPFERPQRAYVDVTLTVTVDGPFDPAELYQTVIEPRCQGVRDWLYRTFQKAARKSAAVQAAIENYTIEGGPDSIADALETVLRGPPFSERHLSNIPRIALTAGVASPQVRREVRYP